MQFLFAAGAALAIGACRTVTADKGKARVPEVAEEPSAAAESDSCEPTKPPWTPPPDQSSLCGSIGRWEYHFDRNAIASSALVDSHILAIVDAGHLLRFAADSLKPTGEKILAERALKFGPVRDGAAVAGFAGGRIARIRAATLNVEPFAEVPGDPRWIGEMPTGEIVVVYQLPHPMPPPYERGAWRARVLASGVDVSLGQNHLAAFFVDARGRLWFGQYSGEFGGRVSTVDLTIRDAKCVRLNARGSESNAFPSGAGILGFASDGRGGVLAYGGESHFGHLLASVSQLPADGPAREIYRSSTDPWSHAAPNQQVPVPKAAEPQGETKTPSNGGFLRSITAAGTGELFAGERAKLDKPDGPISRILRASSDRLIVIAAGHIFEADGQFSRWKWIAHFPMQPLEEGSDTYLDRPEVRDAHLVGNRLVLATERHGYFEVVGQKLVPHAFANQIGAAPTNAMLWGDMLLAWEFHFPKKALYKRKWQSAHALLDPPIPPEWRSSQDDARWREVQWAIADDDTLWIVASEGERLSDADEHLPSRLQVGIRKGGSYTVVSDEVTLLEPERIYAYPNGQLVAEDTGNGSWIWSGGRWSAIEPSNKWLALGPPIASYGGAHVVDIGWQGLRLALVDPSRKPAVKKLEGVPSDARHALAWDPGHLLIAARSGLCLYDFAASKCSPWPNGPKSDRIKLLARDGAGRIWLAGRGLWALDEKQNFVRFDASGSFPLRNMEVEAIHARRDRIALALYERGVIVIDTKSASGASPCPAR